MKGYLLKVLATNSFVLLLGDCSKLLIQLPSLLRQLQKKRLITNERRTNLNEYNYPSLTMRRVTMAEGPELQPPRTVIAKGSKQTTKFQKTDKSQSHELQCTWACLRRTLDPASSIKSMALSGKNRSLILPKQFENVRSSSPKDQESKRLRQYK